MPDISFFLAELPTRYCPKCGPLSPSAKWCKHCETRARRGVRLPVYAHLAFDRIELAAKGAKTK